MRHEKYISEQKTKKGHYLNVSFYYYDSSGSRQRYTHCINVAEYPSPKDAMEAACMIRDKAVRERRTGKLIKHVPTVQELYDQTAVMFNASVKTQKRHDIAYSHGIKDYANKAITDIKTADIQRSINYSINNYSLDATTRVLAVWRQIYKVAAMKEIPVPDKTVGVVIPKDRKPQTVEKKPVTISEEDFNKYIRWLRASYKYTRDPIGKHRRLRYIYMFQIMYHTGLRPSEAFALTRSDFHDDYIEINKAIGSTGTQTRQVVSTKTEQSVRKVPIEEKLKPVIKEMMEKIPDEDLFYDFDGLPMETSVVSAFVSHTSKKAGVDFNLYMCRHSVATSLIQSGTSPRTVQDILGHASYKQSVGYARSSSDERIEAMNDRKML